MGSRFPMQFNWCGDCGYWKINDLTFLCSFDSSYSRCKCLGTVLFGSFLSKIGFFSLIQCLNFFPFYPANVLWKSKVPYRVRAFAWLVAHKKVNTNDILQLRRFFKILNPDWCILCRSRKTIDHLFLHCLITLGLWHKIFSQAGMAWVKLNSICDMMVISFKCFGNSIRGKTFWRITCFSLLWIVWRERNAKIFEDTWKTPELMWDLLHFYVSFWAYCTVILKPYPLSVIWLSCLSICTP